MLFRAGVKERAILARLLMTPGPDRVMTCMQPGVRHRWRLVPEGDATRVQAHVEIPDHRRELIDGYRVKIPASLERLTALVTAP